MHLPITKDIMEKIIADKLINIIKQNIDTAFKVA